MIVIRNTLAVSPELQAEFEARFTARVRLVEQAPGFVRFEVQRQTPARFQHGKGFEPIEAQEILYDVMTWWADEAAFHAWTRSPAFRQAHQDPSPPQMFTRPMTLNILQVLEHSPA
ncbi:antibiotic biosynthesis monooxygenase [Myxococcota bacterium]|nr:antibiotic biosynthesis monooxygenase [Myxococcota bacterium]